MLDENIVEIELHQFDEESVLFCGGVSVGLVWESVERDRAEGG